VFPLSDLMDCVGPMARSAADAALMLAAIAGADARDPTASVDPVPDYEAIMATGVAGLRVGVDPAMIEAVDAPTAAAIVGTGQTLAALGARLVHTSLPDLDGAVRAWRIVCSAGAARAHREAFAGQGGAFGPSLRAVIEYGHSLTVMDLDQALSDRECLRGQMRACFDDVDVLLLPIQTMAAPTLAQMRAASAAADWRERLLRYVAPFALIGLPVLAVPCGVTASGLPIGLQLIARPMQEALLLQTGHALQSATDWHRRHPPRFTA
jgi:amidase